MSSPGRIAARLVAVAGPFYLVWEFLQSPGFTGVPDSWWVASGFCALAAAGDVVMAFVTFVIGMMMFGDSRWFAPPTIARFTPVVLAGTGVHVIVEWVMVHRFGSWGYSELQPVVPGLEVGILAILQPLVILPVAFWLLACWERR